MTDDLRVDDFDYELPPELIAQEPAPRRDASRLLALSRSDGQMRHLTFSDLPSLLRPEDLLVLNDTRVLPARLSGRRAGQGTGGRVEALLVEPLSGDHLWRALLKGSCRPGEPIDFGKDLVGRLVSRDDRFAVLELSTGREPGGVREALERAGRMPTPPYIRRRGDGGGVEDERETMDRERYQTVYARVAGALAAPTAGLHFTQDLLGAVRERGVDLGFLTLHVGLGTFQPVRVDRVSEHRMHAESFVLPETLAAQVSRARGRGGRVVAVGTTVARVLEWRAGDRGQVAPGAGECDLFIRPGHRFRVVDALITNFHLPRSTLLMLVSAFAGMETIRRAYDAAIVSRYRFYSYGDAMYVC